MKHIWTIKKVAFGKKEQNAVKSQKVIFQRSEEKKKKILPENLHERPPIHNIQYLFIKFQLRVM